MNIPASPSRLAGTAAAALIAAGFVLTPPAHASTEDDLNARVASARAAAGCAPLTWAKPGATVAWYSS